ncbi:MAG: hypothetical protein H9536_11205 [Aphanizomenon flos-aquae Clear-A1]|nr:hypothetical protein [Aphanizomenon flos-aquae Clear-A1]
MVKIKRKDKSVRNTDVIPFEMSDEYYIQFVKDNTFISEKSKVTYTTNLRRLVFLCNKKIHHIIFYPEPAAKIIKEHVRSLDSQKSLITALLVVMRSSDVKFAYPKIYNAWYKHFKSVKKDLINRFLEQKPTDKHIASFVLWEDIIKARDSIKDKGGKEYLLLALTTMIPPRRQMDWCKVRVYTDSNDKPSHNTHNLIHLGYKTPFVSLVHYKTAKYYKRWFKSLPENLLGVLNESVRAQPRQWLFTMRDGKPYSTEKSFTRWSNGVLKRHLGNEHASMNTLRHSFADYIRRTQPDLSLKEKSAIARDMGHNIFQSEGYAHRFDLTTKDKDNTMPFIKSIKVPRTNALRM